MSSAQAGRTRRRLTAPDGGVTQKATLMVTIRDAKVTEC
jgi:hypothetical protein